MTIPSNLDSTPDNNLVITNAHSVGAATTGNSGATGVDVGDVPVDFSVHLLVASVSTAVGDCAIVTVQGSTASDFSTGTNHVLAVTAFGAAAIINTQIGAGTTAARGTGDYVVRCHNVGYDANGAPVNCRYIRTQVKTVGATSAIIYKATLQASR